MPSEDLPKIGVLKEYQNKYLLEIEFYEQIQEAQEEAKRFRAKLSAKPLE